MTPYSTEASREGPWAREETHHVELDRKLLVTVNEAARCLSIGRPKMWQLVMRGDVLSIKIGASRRIPVAALEEYVERLSAQAAGPTQAALAAGRRKGYGAETASRTQ